ncbi:MAG: DMT family transporter [Ahrensia sp.]|nr:DMT family transporter [Ahrensia sp.]
MQFRPMEKLTSKRWFPFLVMFLAPAFFSTNLIFGRFIANDVNAFVLAFLRWSAVALILFPLAYASEGKKIIAIIRAHWRFFIFLSFLGMGISGSGVYLGLQLTTATNATLIYSTSPILIILLERVFASRKSNLREIIGILLALIGVFAIVLQGNLATLTTMSFNVGDILILLAALSWAGYSILYRSKFLSGLTSVGLFGVIALFGAIINLPMAAYELASGAHLPDTQSAWLALLGIITLSTLLAFSAYQFGIRALGASVAGLFMYLMTPYGVITGCCVFRRTIAQFSYYRNYLCDGWHSLCHLPSIFN